MVTARSNLMGLTCACALTIAAVAVWLSPRPIPAADNAALEHHRNLGKAFFENPTTHVEAIAEFKRALDLAPGSTREKLNYALALIHGNRVPEGVALLNRSSSWIRRSHTPGSTSASITENRTNPKKRSPSSNK